MILVTLSVASDLVRPALTTANLPAIGLIVKSVNFAQFRVGEEVHVDLNTIGRQVTKANVQLALGLGHR